MSKRRKRTLPRWTLYAAVDVSSDDRLYAGLSFDVSAGGMFVATTVAPPAGTAVAVRVTLPDATRLELGGTVRWVRTVAEASPGLPAGCGIEWTELPPDALRAMMRFAELHEPMLCELEADVEA